MKTFILKSRALRGSVLLITLIVTALIGVTLWSFLTLVQNQNTSVYRSQSWNAMIAASEAGIEEGLAHINSENVINANDLYSNGWSLRTGGGVTAPRRHLANGAYYDVMITNTIFGSQPGPNPVIVSYGYAPPKSTFASLTEPMFAGIFVNDAHASGAAAPRGVLVRTKIRALFNVVMVARQTIDFKGMNVTTDSFDSADPNYSTGGYYTNLGGMNVYMNGQYTNAPGKTKDNGDVATNSGITNSLNVGNAKIKGRVSTGPGGSVAIGSNGSVGTSAWVDGGNTGVEPGRLYDDMNVAFHDVKLPNATWTPAQRLTGNNQILHNGTYYTYFFDSPGDYTFTGQIFNGNVAMYIGGGGKVRLKVDTTWSMSGQDIIRIAPGTTLEIYMQTASASLGGQGVINEGGNALSFTYYGLPSNTALSLGGNAAFIGAIYAPQAAFTMGGGGSTVTDFIGASVSRTVVMNGHFKFHYDENLARAGAARGFVPTQWQEL